MFGFWINLNAFKPTEFSVDKLYVFQLSTAQLVFEIIKFSKNTITSNSCLWEHVPIHIYNSPNFEKAMPKEVLSLACADFY